MTKIPEEVLREWEEECTTWSKHHTSFSVYKIWIAAKTSSYEKEQELKSLIAQARPWVIKLKQYKTFGEIGDRGMSQWLEQAEGMK